MPDLESIGHVKLLSSTSLAFGRTLPMHERPLMDWISASVSTILLGFTIYNFFQQTSGRLEGKNRLPAPVIPVHELNRFWPSCPLAVTDPAS